MALIESKNTSQFWLRAFFAWIGLFLLAFANGALRELGLKSYLSIQEPLAHQLSCLTGVVLWTIFTWLLWSKIKITSARESIVVGVFWFLATMAFETFILNRNLSWTEVFHTYNFLAGEYWGLVLIWIGVMPVAVFNFKEKLAQR